MNYKKIGWIMFSFMSALTIAAEERSPLTFAELPEAVRSRVSQFIDQANITKVEKISDNGYVKFEIESTKTVNKKDFVDTDMVVAADGAIIKMAKEAPFFDLPFPVMKLLNQRYPNLKVDEVESVQTRYFQLTGKNNGKPVYLKIYDNGEIQDLAVDQNGKDNSTLKQGRGQTINRSLNPQQGGAQLPNPGQEDELLIDHTENIFDLNPSK